MLTVIPVSLSGLTTRPAHRPGHIAQPNTFLMTGMCSMGWLNCLCHHHRNTMNIGNCQNRHSPRSRTGLQAGGCPMSDRQIFILIMVAGSPLLLPAGLQTGCRQSSIPQVQHSRCHSWNRCATC